MRRRADSYLAAQYREFASDQAVARNVEVISESQPYTGFLAIQKKDLRFRRHDGTMSEVHTREALMTSRAVVVLPYDPVRDAVLLIQQFRAPLYINGDPAPWVWEPVAGQIDPGESPQTTAHREAMEEAGVTLRALEPAGQVYSSTGSSTEFVYLFIGLADLSVRPEGGGLDCEGEDILTRILSFEELIAGVDAQHFCDLPLVTTALWLARHRDRLRQIA
nr:NUDIX domain-containing protein [Pontibaca salina]